MKKPHELKVRCYTACIIELYEYLAAFPRGKESDKIVETESNKTPLNSMPNVWIRQAHVQGFDWKNITKKSISMFEQMKIDPTIYKIVVETSF